MAVNHKGLMRINFCKLVNQPKHPHVTSTAVSCKRPSYSLLGVNSLDVNSLGVNSLDVNSLGVDSLDVNSFGDFSLD